MSHLIPFRPFIHLLIVLVRYGGIHWRKIPALLPWLLKTLLFEPFRWLEAIYVHFSTTPPLQDDPIFVLGFYRSGTTWLQQLLSTDPDFRTPTVFQTVLPEFMLFLEPILKPFLQFISNKLNIQNQYHRLPFNWDFPGEEDVAINALSYLCDFNRIYQYPSYANQLLEQHFITAYTPTQEAWKKAHRYYVKKLQLRYKDKRLILKSPPNTGRIALLKSLYPQAKFIFLKRDPNTCLISYQRLWQLNQVFTFENYSESQVAEVRDLIYQSLHQSYALEKAELNKNELIELHYEEFIKEPLKTVRCIYTHFDFIDNQEKQSIRKKLINERAGYQMINHQKT